MRRIIENTNVQEFKREVISNWNDQEKNFRKELVLEMNFQRMGKISSLVNEEQKNFCWKTWAVERNGAQKVRERAVCRKQNV